MYLDGFLSAIQEHLPQRTEVIESITFRRSEMKKNNKHLWTRREFTAATSLTTAFTIVPRHVLGGPEFIAPSDKITLAVIGLGRQGMAVMMNLLQIPEIQ